LGVDSKFLNTFLYTYRSFASPDQLWMKLSERYRVPDTVDPKTKEVVQMRVRVVLKLWVQRFNDEEERKLLTQISHFIDTETNDQYVYLVVLAPESSYLTS